ncbi:uncharacterized protein BDV17DRAFT_267550 [Aspergillus undulatus]|uniref:uncharacterized protein n=1 Tax=Aspergillus undulatus TaxID=1810928 RepID=UPI003CCDBA38
MNWSRDSVPDAASPSLRGPLPTLAVGVCHPKPVPPCPSASPFPEHHTGAAPKHGFIHHPWILPANNFCTQVLVLLAFSPLLLSSLLLPPSVRCSSVHHDLQCSAHPLAVILALL